MTIALDDELHHVNYLVEIAYHQEKQGMLLQI